MKVRELMALLAKVDQNATVEVCYRDGECFGKLVEVAPPNPEEHDACLLITNQGE